MKQRKIGRPVSLAFMVLTGILAMASFAWACTIFQGKMVVTASATGTQAGPGTLGGSATAVGDGLGMTLCSLTQGAYVATIGGTFSIALSPQNCAPQTNGTLPQGGYDVNFFPNYPANGTGGAGLIDCMSIAQGGLGIPIGSISVDSSGNGSGGPYGLPAHAASGGRAAVCVTNKLSALGGPSPAPSIPVGMAAPFYII